MNTKILYTAGIIFAATLSNNALANHNVNFANKSSEEVQTEIHLEGQISFGKLQPGQSSREKNLVIKKDDLNAYFLLTGASGAYCKTAPGQITPCESNKGNFYYSTDDSYCYFVRECKANNGQTTQTIFTTPIIKTSNK